MEGDQASIPSRTQWLRRATAAAAAHDGVGMAEALWASGLVTELAWITCRQFAAIPFADAEFIVAGAVAELYSAVSAGKAVERPEALLRTAAYRRAVNWSRRLQRLDEAVLPDELPNRGPELERSDEETLARQAALEVLRGLLPQIGRGSNIVAVWTMLLDGVENDVAFSAREVATALGISTNHVGVLKHRGRVRLEALLREQGLDEAADALPETFFDGPEAVVEQDDGDHAEDD